MISAKPHSRTIGFPVINAYLDNTGHAVGGAFKKSISEVDRFKLATNLTYQFFVVHREYLKI